MGNPRSPIGEHLKWMFCVWALNQSESGKRRHQVYKGRTYIKRWSLNSANSVLNDLALESRGYVGTSCANLTRIKKKRKRQIKVQWEKGRKRNKETETETERKKTEKIQYKILIKKKQPQSCLVFKSFSIVLTKKTCFFFSQVFMDYLAWFCNILSNVAWLKLMTGVIKGHFLSGFPKLPCRETGHHLTTCCRCGFCSK